MVSVTMVPKGLFGFLTMLSSQVQHLLNISCLCVCVIQEAEAGFYSFL